ncbi:MAG: metabolite traffic protein EboE [Verrucomicrobiota bacterium]
MRLSHQIDLGYCTNIHRGETWAETFEALRSHTDEVRKRVCPNDPYGIGLRLSAAAAQELSGDQGHVSEFRGWLEDCQSYVFTINGFPYGAFHGERVKEQVYAPDWTTRDRLDYTNLLFDLVAELAPEGQSVSVSTLPGSFKEFIDSDAKEEQVSAMIRNLLACSDHIERLREKTGRDIHLGLEPEPLGFFETSGETVLFFEKLLDAADPGAREALLRNLGVNYDTCHLAVEYEEPDAALGAIRDAGIRLSKIHLSSALTLVPQAEAIEKLKKFQEGVYLHQVIVRDGEKISQRFRDLPEALAWEAANRGDLGDEWRVHFHIPLHAKPDRPFGDTRSHLEGVLRALASSAESSEGIFCHHFEMETYTWEVLPESMRSQNVVDQLVAEYGWCLREFENAGFVV